MGLNERDIRAEIEMAPKAKDHPGVVRMAITLAQEMDKPEMSNARIALSKQIQGLLKELDGPKKKSGGRMATISAMSGHRKAAQ
ncbi:hypothetical protein CRM90_27910 [Mycobacterium sp. ENV421]|nr:hypothetical protein CRM90_27910 [Mycobacterium sp. ENV421]